MPSSSSSLLACIAVAAALAIAPAAADVSPPPGLNCGAAEVAQCGGDPVATGCDVLELQGAVADSCGGGGRHAFYSPFNQPALPNGFGFGRRKLIFEENNGVSSGTLVKNGNTARLTGRLVPGRCVGGPGRGPDNKRIENAVCTPTTTADGFDIDMHLVATTTNRIKNENRCGSRQGVDPATWTHWDLDTTQNNTLTGFGSVEGLTVHLRLVLNAGYPWHEGYGASQKNRFYGLSSWINFERIEIGPTYTGPQPLNIAVGSSRNHMGDLNLAAGCACRCVCPQGNCTPPDDVCGNGILDVGEDCDPGIADSGCCHDNCTFIQDSLCRAADGECDQPEYCTGSSASCPTDTFLNNVPCGGRFGLCDVSVRAQCDGSGPLCPQDAPALLDTNMGPVDFHRFNAISFGNLYAVSGDVEGRAAVRDHFSVGAFSVGDKLCTGIDAGCCDIPQPFSLVVGRNAHWEGGALYPLGFPNTDACGSPGECAFVGGNATGDGPSSQASPLPEMVCGICGTEGCLDAQFDAAQQYFTAVSDALAAAPDNAVYSTRYQAIEVMCNSANESRYTVTIPDTVLSAATWWTVSNCNFDAEWVINVGGTGNVLFTGGDLGTVVERTIFNVPGMGRQVNVTNTQLPGNLLAPHSTLYQPGGVILANVVVGSIEFMLQINHPNCTAFRDVDLRVFLVSQGSQRRQGSTNVGVAGCPPDDVLVVASHGQFLPGDLVTISVGPQGPSEQARIDELLLVGPSPGEYAFRFTAPLTNAGDYTATSTVTMTVPDPVNSGRTPAAVTRQTAAYPCVQPPSTPATGDVSAAPPVAASASSAIAVVAMILLALVW